MAQDASECLMIVADLLEDQGRSELADQLRVISARLEYRPDLNRVGYHDRSLAIGGPLDGHVFMGDYRPHIQAAAPSHQVPIIHQDQDSRAPIPYEEVHYRPEHIRGRRKVFTIYVQRLESIDEALAKLIEGYRS